MTGVVYNILVLISYQCPLGKKKIKKSNWTSKTPSCTLFMPEDAGFKKKQQL